GVLVARGVALTKISRVLRVPFREVMPWLSLGGIAIVAMLAAIPSLLISSHLTLPSLYVLPISCVMYFGAYSVLLLALGLLTEGEKDAIEELVLRCRRWLYAAAS